MNSIIPALFAGQNRRGQGTVGRRPSRLQLEALEDRLVPSATILDLTTPEAQAVVGGVIFQQSGTQPTGSGVIDSFVRLKGTGNATTEQGYNTDARPLQFNENRSPTFTHALQLGSVPVVTIKGVAYREFLLDINQTASSPMLSLDELRLFVGSGPRLSGYDPATRQLTGLDPVYDLDANGDIAVKLNYLLAPGSGGGDVKVYVPDAYFTGASANSYLYLYSRFGDTYSANAGFEEWAVRANGTVTPPPAFSSISGFVYLDQNDDRLYENGEPPIAGVVITLTGTDSLGRTVDLVTQTDQNGYYQFLDLLAGTYTITETQPSGFQDGSVQAGSQGGVAGVNQISDIALGSGINDINNNFGELSPISRN